VKFGIQFQLYKSCYWQKGHSHTDTHTDTNSNVTRKVIPKA